MRIESATGGRVDPMPPLGRTQQSPLAAARQGCAEISATGRLFVSGQQALAALPPVRNDQVQQFQTLLSAGRYQADDDACAIAMLSGQDVANHV